MKYLDKMDAEENETPDPVEEDKETDDPGSDRPFTTEKGHSSVAAEGIVDVHRDEESDTDDEETENMRIGQSDKFWMVRVDELDDVDDDGEEEEEERKKENSSGKIDEEVGEDDELVEAHEVASSYDEDDVVEYDEGDDEDEDEEEEVDNEEQDLGSASNKEQVTFTEGEIDGHDQGDDGADEDDNGETGKKDIGEVGYEVKDWAEEQDDDDEEENGSGYLVQPAIQPLDIADDNGDVSRDSDIKHANDEENEEEYGNDDLDVEEDVEDDMEHDHQVAQFRTAPSSSSHFKRKRCDEDDKDEDMADSDKEDDMFDE